MRPTQYRSFPRIVPFLLVLAAFSHLPLWAQGSHTQQARQMCEGVQNEEAQLLTHLDENTLCQLRDHSTFPAVRELAGQVAEIVDALNVSDQGNWSNHPEFMEKYRELSRLLNSSQQRSSRAYRTPPRNPLATKLARLESSFVTDSKRQRALRTERQKKDYIKRLLEAAQETPTGRAIIECYRNADSATVNPLNNMTDILNTISFDNDAIHNGGSQFMPNLDGGGERPISLSITIVGIQATDPMGMMENVLHEMQHGCNAEVHGSNLQNYNRCTEHLTNNNIAVPDPTGTPENATGPTAEYTRAYGDFYRGAAVDEVLAYGRSSKAMLEVAASWPERFCSQLSYDYFNSRFTSASGPMVWARQADGMLSGTEYFEDVMEYYTKPYVGGQRPEYVYQYLNGDEPVRDKSTGRRIIAPALLERFNREQASWQE